MSESKIDTTTDDVNTKPIKSNKNGRFNAVICPSMLSCDFSEMGIEAQKMIKSGADWLHMDIMDGHFVPNITMGPMIVKSLRNKYPNIILDCHFMVSYPIKWIKPFSISGANHFTYHYETGINKDGNNPMSYHDNIINTIIKHNMKPSIVFKPKTEIKLNTNEYNENNITAYDVIKKYHNKLIHVLIMTVEPGFGGQKFMKDMMLKVKFLRKEFPNLNIQVDGGVNIDTINTCAKAGANIIVSGSGVFKYKDNNGKLNPKEAIHKLRECVNTECN